MIDLFFGKNPSSVVHWWRASFNLETANSKELSKGGKIQ